MSSEEVRARVGSVLKLRRLAWEKIRRMENHYAEDGETTMAHWLPRVCVLASSSRGGTSVTAELLQWQGADCTNPRGRLLTLPGEEKPHLILAGLAFPSRPERFDDLTEADARTVCVSSLLEEMTSEVGYPMVSCDNLALYAVQLYRRLLLQWPLLLTSLEMESAIAHLSQELRAAFPNGYHDSVTSRSQVLAACIRCFPFIRSSFYDCWYARSVDDLAGMAGEYWSIEEPPFILPPPWRNATAVELEQGCLLLRDPSNAWRLRFWCTVFDKQRMNVLHLYRDPRESVQGLCDGWNHPFGFQTMPSAEALTISGYTDNTNREGSEWKRHRLNFSVSRSLSRKLIDERQQMGLVQICAYQWRDAHEHILAETKRLGLTRTIISFADLRRNPSEIFRRICEAVRLECSGSGITYAQSFSDRWVMATTLVRHAGHDRWRISQFSADIKRLVLSGYFDEVSMKCGFGKVSLGVDSAPLSDEPLESGTEYSHLVDAVAECSAQTSLSYA
jgi:hypothetical protein